jgi:hypothetical protein
MAHAHHQRASRDTQVSRKEAHKRVSHKKAQRYKSAVVSLAWPQSGRMFIASHQTKNRAPEERHVQQRHMGLLTEPEVGWYLQL